MAFLARLLKTRGLGLILIGNDVQEVRCDVCFGLSLYFDISGFYSFYVYHMSIDRQEYASSSSSFLFFRKVQHFHELCSFSFRAIIIW
jgi:hypothetical protein